MRDGYEVLRTCRALELAMADFYEDLALFHQEDAEMARLWKKTAREEVNHAAQFTLLLDTMSDEISAIRADALTLEEIRRAISATRERFQQHHPTVREALVAAIDFEESMSCFHADQVAVFDLPRLCALFKAMMAADHDHVQALRRGLATRGASTQAM
jgi:hypothetical protein